MVEEDLYCYLWQNWCYKRCMKFEREPGGDDDVGSEVSSE